MAGLNCGSHHRYTAGCTDCQRVECHYDRRRRKLIRQGKWLHPVPAEKVLTHIDSLRAAGMSLAAVARAANVAQRTVYTLVREPRKTIRGGTAQALLAVQPQKTTPAGMVHATGTTRRIRALVAAGYSLTDIARSLDKHLQAVWEWAWGKQSMVSVETHQAVCGLYDQLSVTPGPSVRARNTGVRNGWPPPLAWDDAALDDPDGRPYDADPDADRRVIDREAIRRALAGEQTPLTALEKHHAVHRGLAAGMTVTAISTALHLSYDQARLLASRPLPQFELAA